MSLSLSLYPTESFSLSPRSVRQMTLEDVGMYQTSLASTRSHCFQNLLKIAPKKTRRQVGCLQTLVQRQSSHATVCCLSKTLHVRTSCETHAYTHTHTHTHTHTDGQTLHCSKPCFLPAVEYGTQRPRSRSRWRRERLVQTSEMRPNGVCCSRRARAAGDFVLQTDTGTSCISKPRPRWDAPPFRAFAKTL